MKLWELWKGRWTTHKLGKVLVCISKTNDDKEEEEGERIERGSIYCYCDVCRAMANQTSVT